MAVFNIRVTGPQADLLTRELAERLKDEFGGQYEPQHVEAGEPDGTKVDPVAVAALVLSIPGSILATVQLGERMELAKKWKALRAWVQARLAEGQQLELSGPGLEPRALAEAEASDVIDAAVEAERSQE